MDRFETLLQLYLSNKATEEEVDELLRLAHSQKNEPLIHKIMDEALAEETETGSLREVEIVNNILASKPGGFSAQGRLWVATAAAIAAITVFGLWLYPKESNTEMVAQSAKVFSVKGKDYIHLPDGTSVTLEDGASLSYSETFSQDREITLTGQAFFDVAHDPSHPFRVHTGKVVTTVLGTAFNIDASSGKEVTVTVVRGKVAVGDDHNTYGTIAPNEQISVNTSTDKFVKTSVDSQTAVRWKQEFFILYQIPLTQASEMIAKRFNVKVKVENEELKKCVISAWFLNNESLEEIVAIICELRQAEYEIKNGIVTIKGGRGCE